MPEVMTVQSSSNHLQNYVGAIPHPAHQRRAPRIRKHTRGAAESRQPQQHSEYIIVQDAEVASPSDSTDRRTQQAPCRPRNLNYLHKHHQ
ncbi:jg692 [Pararge aegeria aegeria]|uniref:Jg692 protein n=1 Tax=Pararge aegeria aegeria TaxID=348720 RepID=A0A8S4R8J2_9NEOP|nr:jg692 [Pararge aegeria aegeria]